jgi:hypothetical protein
MTIILFGMTNPNMMIIITNLNMTMTTIIIHNTMITGAMSMIVS